MAYYHSKRAKTAYEYIAYVAQLANIDKRIKHLDLVEINKFILETFDRDKMTLAEAIEKLKTLEEANPHEDIVYHVDHISVYVPCKPGPGGYKAHREDVYGDFTQTIDFYSLCRHIMSHKAFLTPKQKAEQKRLEGYRKWRRSEECDKIINDIIENEWNRDYVQRHFSPLTYEMLLEKDDEWQVINGWSFFRTEYKETEHSEKYTSKTQARLESLKAKVKNGEKLTTADRMWMSSHKIKASDLK